MSDLAKLKKQVIKTTEVAGQRRTELNDAIDNHAKAVWARAVAQEALDQAEALETARELRSSKK